MSKREDKICLQDMLTYAEEAVELIGDAGRDGLMADRVKQLALTRLVEIVGEARQQDIFGNPGKTPGDPLASDHWHAQPSCAWL